MAAWKRFMGETADVPAARSPSRASPRVGQLDGEAGQRSASPSYKRAFFGSSSSTSTRHEWTEEIHNSASFAMNATDIWASGGGDSAHEDLDGTGLRMHYQSALPRPKFVKDYVLGPKLGEGAFSKVKEGMDSRTLRIVAVKIIDRKFLQKTRNGLESIKRETAIMKALGKHPNVIELIRVIDDAELPKLYLVVELANGCDLHKLTESAPGQRLPPSQARYYTRQLMTGLAYIHGRNVVHRDIKPANLMLTAPDGILKISDFGVAEFLDKYKPEDEVRRSSGTPAFQAPETVNGDASYSGMKTDVWSAGVTLYYCLTGKLPFYADNLFKLYETIGNGEFTIPDFVDEQAQDLLRRMLTVNWSERASVREVLNHPWMKLKDDKSQFVEVPKRQPQVLRMVSTIYADENIDSTANTRVD